MRLEATVHCEAPDCDELWHAGLTRFDGRTLASFPPGWVVLIEHGEGRAEATETSFCDVNCAMKWCAKRPPPEIIE